MQKDMHTHANQNGQVLPLGLALLVFGLLGAFMLFNTGQLASDKMRLSNAADAAAYSGALWQARALNYQAYANRAMVANQVAIAQAVTLQSWMNYASIASQNISTVTKVVPFVNVGTTAIDRVIATAEPVVDAVTTGMLKISDAAISALSTSQTLVHLAAMANTEEVISTVASETDARFHTQSLYGLAASANNVNQWLRFSERKNKRDISAVVERQQLIMASRDQFTRNRNWTFLNNWIPTTVLLWHKVRREGDTRLVANQTVRGVEWEWVAKDTLSLHTKTIFKGIFGGWFNKTVELPVAWSSAYANSNSQKQRIGPCRFARSGPCTGFLGDNERAERWANFNIHSVRGASLKPKYGYGGVRKFWVLSDETRIQDDARLMVRVEVSLPANTLREANDVMSADVLSTPVAIAGKTLSSVSAAQVLYRRPRHHYLAERQREKPNEYNPYWQVQLAPVSLIERVKAAGLRSGGLVSRNKQGEER